MTLHGPGLIYIDMQAGDRFFKEVQLSLFMMILYVCFYLLMFVIVAFDRIEIQREIQQQAAQQGDLDLGWFNF